MVEWFGFIGKLLRVNLTKGKIVEEPLRSDIVENYLGCTGYAARLLWEEMPPRIDPLSPENKIIFSTGPLTGTLCPSGGSYHICFKSPLTGIWGESRSGGIFGPKLKFAGFDFVVIEGRSENPVYLRIDDGEAEIKSAEHLWGKTVHETTDALLEEIGDPGASIACIGPAGENLVRFASVMNDHDRAAGRCGGGAVLGSKNLKAVAVNGTQDIKVARPEEFLELSNEACKILEKNPYRDLYADFGTIGLVNILNEVGALPTRNWRTSYFENANKISGETLKKKYLIKRRACFACTFGCGRYSEVRYGPWQTPPHEGPEYETADMTGAQTLLQDLEAIVRINYLCNNYGLDTISTGSSIAFAIECYERGLISDRETGGLKLNWGNAEAVVALVELIAKRENIGNILAEGVKRASEAIGRGSSEFAVHGKGLELPAHDPRSESKVLALQYAVAPRGACHMHPTWPSWWDSGGLDCGTKAFGLPWPPADKFSEVGVKKGLVTKIVQLQGTVSEILGVCIFFSHGMEENCLTPARYAAILSALTGWDIDQFKLWKIAERVYTLKRCFNVREGITKKDDMLPKRTFEPIESGPSKGRKVENLKGMLEEFYEAFEWEKETGIPTRKKLEELGLNDVVNQIFR